MILGNEYGKAHGADVHDPTEFGIWDKPTQHRASLSQGRFLHYRRLFLVEPTPDDGWPRPDGCAKMVPDESQCFRIETTPEHSKVLLEFAACSMLHDPQMIHNFLMEYPFCVEGLLVYSEIARQSGEHQQAFQILRRAVYATECGFDGAFSPFQETQAPRFKS